MDDLGHIFKVIADDSAAFQVGRRHRQRLTNVRATGASIKGTNGKSQGVIPSSKWQ